MLIPRVLTALVFAPGLLALVWLGGAALTAVCVALSLLMTYEMLTMAHKGAPWPLHAACYASSLSVAMAVATGGRGEAAWASLGSVVVVFFLTTLVLPGDFAARTAHATRALALTLYASALLPLIALVRAREGDGLALAILAAFGPWAADTGAYFAGRALGRHKLAPSISPAKTREGAVGGIVLSLAFAALLRLLLAPPTGAVHWYLLAVCVGGFGMLGDLVESLLKRSFGAKDSSRLIPGHGGVLDRFDSMLFASWAAYAYSSLLLS